MDELRKPTSHTDDTGDWQNEIQAYDTATAGDETTYADDTGHLASADDDPDIRFHGVAAAGHGYIQLDIYFKWKTNDLTGNDEWGVVVSVDGGSSYPYTLLAKGANRSTLITQSSVNIPSGTNLTQVYVKLYKDKLQAGDADTIYIYDIWLIGQYVEAVPQLCQLTIVGSAGVKKKTKKDFVVTVSGTTGVKRKTKKKIELLVTGVITMVRYISMHRKFKVNVPPVTTMARQLSMHRTFMVGVTAITSVAAVRKFFRTMQLVISATTGLGAFTIKKFATLVVSATTSMTRSIDVHRTFALVVSATTTAKKKTSKLFKLVIQAATTCTAFRKFFQLCSLLVSVTPGLSKKTKKKILLILGGIGGGEIYPIIGGHHVISVE